MIVSFNLNESNNQKLFHFNQSAKITYLFVSFDKKKNKTINNEVIIR